MFKLNNRGSFLFGGGDKAPDQGAIAAEEKKKIRSGAKKNTIMTGPLGLTDEPTVAKKTLLGQ